MENTQEIIDKTIKETRSEDAAVIRSIVKNKWGDEVTSDSLEELIEALYSPKGHVHEWVKVEGKMYVTVGGEGNGIFKRCKCGLEKTFPYKTN